MNQLPEGWELKQIQDIAEVKGGKRLPKGSSLVEEITPYPYIRVTNMFMGGIDLKEIQYVPENVQPKIKNYTISKEDLFISVAGTLGIVGEVPKELDKANLTENADKLTNIKTNKKFLLYVLMSSLIQNEIEKQTTSNAQPKLALTRIKTFQIPVPPLEEQKKIADILSIVDKKIAFVEDNISQTKELKKGLMQKLLTEGIGHTEFKDSEVGRIPENWDFKALSLVTEKVNVGFVGTCEKFYTNKDNGVPMLRTGNLQNEKLDLKELKYVTYDFHESNKKSKLKPFDLLVARHGSSGQCVMVPENFADSNCLNIVIIRNDFKICNPMFLQYMFNSFIVQKQMLQKKAGSTQGVVNTKEIASTKVLIPPLEEQKQIAEILSTVDQKLEVLKDKKESFEELKKGLMQKLLTGKMRV